MAKNQASTKPEQYNPGSHISWNHNQMPKNNGPSNRFEQYNSLIHNSWNINDKAENKGTYRPKQSVSESQQSWNINHFKHGPNQMFPPQALISQEYLDSRLNNSNQPNHFDDGISPQMLGANAIPLLSRASRSNGTKRSQNGAPPELNKWVDNRLSNVRKPNTPANGFSDENNSHYSAQHSAGSKSPTPSLEPASKKRKTLPGESSFETKLGNERSATPPLTSGLFVPKFSLLESPYHEKSSIIEGSPNGKVEGVEFVIDTEPQPAGPQFAKDKSKFSFLKQLAKTFHDLESSADGSHEEKYDNPARHLKPLPDFVSLADIDKSASFVTRIPDTDSSKTPLAPHFSV